MTFNKPPEWGSRFSFPENLENNSDDLQMRVTEKIYVQMVDNYETAVVEEIASAARAAGVTDCTVLNKKAILEAINKQIPTKPDLEGDGYSDGELVIDTGICPRCRQDYEIECHTPKFCENCGQALDWSDCDA